MKLNEKNSFKIIRGKNYSEIYKVVGSTKGGNLYCLPRFIIAVYSLELIIRVRN